MKNKSNILIIFTLIVMISIVVIVSLIPKRSDYIDTKFVILNTYSNYAWTTNFQGSAIYDDGTIYTWNETNKNKLNEYQIGTPQGIKKYIEDEAKKSNKKVSDRDLIELKKYINSLKDNIKLQYPGADQGTNTISVITNNNIEIVLKKTGDSVGENKTQESQNIIKIVEKYFE